MRIPPGQEPIIEWDPAEVFDVPAESAEVSEREEIQRKILDYMERAMLLLDDYQSRQPDVAALRMSFRAMMLAIGFNLVAGADSPTDLAQKCGVSKQALGKCLNHFIEQLGIDPLPGQRGEDGRSRMASARRKQLETEKAAPVESAA